MEFEILNLSNIYSVAGAIITAMYLPQTIKVLRARNRVEEISILTWTVWGICLFISFLYALQIADDLRIALVNFAGCLFCFLISSATVYKRQKYKSPDGFPPVESGTGSSYKKPNRI